MSSDRLWNHSQSLTVTGLVGGLGLVGCEPPPKRTLNPPPANQTVETTTLKRQSVESATRVYYVDVVEFNGHRYLYIDYDSNYHNATGGPVHDPDCPCQKQKGIAQ